MRTSSKPLRSRRGGRAPVISCKEKPPAHTRHHRFSDETAAQEYHNFASQLRGQSRLVDDGTNLFSCWSRGPQYEGPLLRDKNRSQLTSHEACREILVKRSGDSHDGDDRPTSAFDCESDEDEGAKIVESLRAFFHPKRGAEMKTEAKRRGYGDKTTRFFRDPKERLARQREAERSFQRMKTR